jgi:hypothetical protein
MVSCILSYFKFFLLYATFLGVLSISFFKQGHLQVEGGGFSRYGWYMDAGTCLSLSG